MGDDFGRDDTGSGATKENNVADYVWGRHLDGRQDRKESENVEEKSQVLSVVHLCSLS